MSVDLTNAEVSTPLHLSVLYGNLETTKTLVERDASLTNFDMCGMTPLLLAAKKGKLEVFYYLTEIGADINILDAMEFIKILLDKEMSVDVTNVKDSTPLHLSALHGNLEATNTLVVRGAAINHTNIFGDTPLMLAVYNGNFEGCLYLKKGGIDIGNQQQRQSPPHYCGLL